jgi:hypothetical protein
LKVKKRYGTWNPALGDISLQKVALDRSLFNEVSLSFEDCAFKYSDAS